MSTSVLLSIKPEFAEKIFTGQKQYEFRKIRFKRQGLQKVYVYASAPVSKVIGEFDIEEILEQEPNALWRITNQAAGITKDFFDAYFKNRQVAFAIKVRRPKRYHQPLDLREHFQVQQPPQSFVYIYRSLAAIGD